MSNNKRIKSFPKIIIKVISVEQRTLRQYDIVEIRKKDNHAWHS